MNKSRDAESANAQHVNPDSDASSSAPLGTGAVATGAGLAAAAGGGLAGAAAGSVAGPVGAAAGGIAGVVVGAVAGGFAGKFASEPGNPSTDEAYWRENHARQPFAADADYDRFAAAYRVGYEGHSKYGADFRTFESAEPVIRDDYAMSKSDLEWDQARKAANAAWKRRTEAAEHHSSYPGNGV